MFNIGQVTAVRSVMRIAGFDGVLRVARIDSGDERLFVIPDADLERMSHRRETEQIIGQLLGCKVALVPESRVPAFEDFA